MPALVADAAHPFVVATVGFGSLIIFVNLALLARRKRIQKALLVAVVLVTLGAASMLGKVSG